MPLDLGSINNAVTSAKAIKSVADWLVDKVVDQKIKERVQELQIQTADLMMALYESREELLRLQDEKASALRKNGDLETRLSQKLETTFEAPFYWTGSGEKREGPFCQRCHDIEGKLVRLQNFQEDQWICYGCGKRFNGPNHRRPKSRHTSRNSGSGGGTGWMGA